MSGFVKIHRKITEWEWYDDINCRLVFLHLILTANHEAKPWKGQIIDRGEVVYSVEGLAKDVGISLQNAKTALKKLKKSNQQRTPELTSRATNKFTVLTICNYDSYQSKDNGSASINQPSTNQQPNHPLTTTKEVKNKEYKKDTTKVVSKKDAPPPENLDPISEGLKTEQEEKEKKVPPKKRKVFKPPTLNEVEEHLIEKFPDFENWKREASKFWNYYDSKNWVVGKSKMVRWKSACTNWVNRSNEFSNERTGEKANGGSSGKRRPFTERVQKDNVEKNTGSLSF